MPDTMLLFKWFQASIPNLGIASIAANIDRKAFDVRLLDLIMKPYGVKRTVEEAVREFRPHVVGLSAMSFQYRSALQIARLVKSIDPSIRTVLGGYHATLDSDEIASGQDRESFDFIVRGEGEATARALFETLESGSEDFGAIPGISFRSNGGFVHNPDRPLLDLSEIALPDRESRIFGYKSGLNGMIDSVETSRGCPMSCNFCSIREMYGRSFRKFSIDRVIEDIRKAKSLGAKRIFFADDNITLDLDHFRALCRAIVDNRLNDIRFSTQATTCGIASSEDLVRLMKEANFTLVFLGIEGISEANLAFLKKGDILQESLRAIELLHKYEIQIMGGIITGLPDDRPEDIRAVFRFVEEHRIAVPIVWCATPYPKTRLRQELLKEGLVANPGDYYDYNGWHTNVRTRHMSRRRLSYERSKGYFRFLVRTFLLGKNYYVAHAGKQFEFRLSEIVIHSFTYFWRCISGTWQSTHSAGFYPFEEWPLVPFFKIAAALEKRKKAVIQFLDAIRKKSEDWKRAIEKAKRRVEAAGESEE
jgi:radical SAM superfamily enzyme YgiQ (UPF0313 family)